MARTLIGATVAALVLLAFGSPTLRAQPESPTGTQVTQITGLTGVKKNTKGRLQVDGASLHFTQDKQDVEVAASSIEDVITGNDSQRLVHGTLGTLTMFAPYGGGRFLSLFRTKLDTLTIKYRDPDGGLHGAIFTLPAGKAEQVKKDLLAQGAHTTAPTQDDAGKTPDAKEPKR